MSDPLIILAGIRTPSHLIHGYAIYNDGLLEEEKIVRDKMTDFESLLHDQSKAFDACNRLHPNSIPVVSDGNDENLEYLILGDMHDYRDEFLDNLKEKLKDGENYEVRNTSGAGS